MNCPYCAEDIKDEAIVCPKCRRDFSFIVPVNKRIYELENNIRQINTSLTNIVRHINNSSNKHKCRVEESRKLKSLGSMLVIVVSSIIMYSFSEGIQPFGRTSFFVLLIFCNVLIPTSIGFYIGKNYENDSLITYIFFGFSTGIILSLISFTENYINFKIENDRHGSSNYNEDFFLWAGLFENTLIIIGYSTLGFLAGGLFGEKFNKRKTQQLEIKLVEESERGNNSYLNNPKITRIDSVIRAVGPILALIGTIIAAYLQSSK